MFPPRWLNAALALLAAWLTAEAPAHATDGNLTGDGRWSWPPGPREVIPRSSGTRASRVAVAWDAENRLVRLETAPAAVSNGVPRLRLDFGYDWQNRRLSKAVLTNWNGTAYAVTNASRFLYDGWNLVAELNATNAPVRSYVWGLDLGGEALLLPPQAGARRLAQPAVRGHHAVPRHVIHLAALQPREHEGDVPRHHFEMRRDGGVGGHPPARHCTRRGHDFCADAGEGGGFGSGGHLCRQMSLGKR